MGYFGGEVIFFMDMFLKNFKEGLLGVVLFEILGLVYRG